MKIELWNTYHLMTLAVFAGVLILFCLLLKNRNESAQKKILLVIAFANLALHFLKLLIPQYKDDMPISIRKVTFENICATTTIMMPFVLLSNNKVMKDYIVYMGILGGLAALIYPTEAFNRELTNLDVIRFYICHIVLFIVPFCLVFFGLHKLETQRVLCFPLIFLLVECLILANEIILMEAGFVDLRGNDFLTYNYRNSNFIFGPTEDLKELSDKLVDPLVPKIFKTVGAGAHAGAEKYLPVVWLAVPCFVYFTLIGYLFCFIFRKCGNKGSAASF